jgi:phosphoribosylformylglycinamidine synthase II
MSTKNAGEPVVNEKLALDVGLTTEEYQRVLQILGRVPTYTELGMYGAMWSEHTSYKNSILAIKEFLPRSGKRTLVEAGEENAGLIDLGGEWALCFKIESHNHPSAVEPFQGAATGVGGIQRDIFTMGARPIASLNSLRFGDLSNPRVRFLLDGVVRGIGDYGNSFGVPTVGGEVYFDECYTDNPLVNAMSIGVVNKKHVASAASKGVGNVVMIAGSSTGRDGIHGASLLASRDFDEQTEHLRPNVQVGDPFTEKLLLEATLEAIAAGTIVAIQDMGAAGITCSTTEMSARSGLGMNIDLDAIPLREADMTAYEILLSESQERMLLVVEPANVDAVARIFDKWDLSAVAVGTVTQDGLIILRRWGKEVARVPAESFALGAGAPVYRREWREPSYLKEVRAIPAGAMAEPQNHASVLRALVSSPNIASKRWVFRQYDSMVRSNSAVLWNGDAAVIRVKEIEGLGIAAKTDCNGRFVYLNPYRGGQIAVAESARNVVCAGGEPAAVTNCLNFGNPYDPEVYYQFREAIRGIGDACRAFETPVTGGNVSFYNQSPNARVYPTPVIGMVGLVDMAHTMSANFKTDGDCIVLLGSLTGELGGSEYLRVMHGLIVGDAPQLDLTLEIAVQRAALEMIRSGLVHSAHDISDGGLAVTLAESCICDEESVHGASVDLPASWNSAPFLYGESQSCIVVSAAADSLAAVLRIAETHNVPAHLIGTVGGEALQIKGVLACGIDELCRLYFDAIAKLVHQ